MTYRHPIIADRDPFIELRDALCDNESIIDSLRYLILEEGYGRAEIAREFKGGGKLNRLVRGDLSLPVGGASDVLRAIYPAEIRDDGKLHAIAGDTWIALVEWAADGTQSASVVHQYGNATLDQESPHYADQAQLFVDEKWRTALFERADIEAVATRRYRPGRE